MTWAEYPYISGDYGSESEMFSYFCCPFADSWDGARLYEKKSYKGKN